jgi:hypothetical protein
MSKTNDGGPAFPMTQADYEAAEMQRRYGMTLRDYFAAAALTGHSANPEFAQCGRDRLAALAFELADAMLAERKKGGAK